jgi:hypothetical protein
LSQTDSAPGLSVVAAVARGGSGAVSFRPLPLTAAPAPVMLGRMDHDQRFKTLLREFFAEFLRLFFAGWAARLDLSAVEWLDKELYADPPEGTRHVLDLVARVGGADPGDGPAVLLVHVEVESPDRTTELKPRLPFYYHFLRDRYQLPVLPVVLYLKVGLDGIGIDSVMESVLGLEVIRFQYLYVGLPALDGLQYMQGDSWLGVALSALMRIPHGRAAWLGAEALRRLAGAPLTQQQRFLLAECVQSYLPLDEQQKQELERLLQTETYAEVRTMNKTVYEEGLEKGLEQGRRVGHLDLVWAMLDERFGPVPVNLRTRLEHLSLQELRRLALKIGTAQSLIELDLSTPAPPDGTTSVNG